MKYYVELPCDNMEIISSGIYNFLKTVPGLLSTTKFGWHFVDCKQLLASVPELIDFFKKYNPCADTGFKYCTILELKYCSQSVKALSGKTLNVLPFLQIVICI